MGNPLVISFLQFHPIVISIWNEWFGWLHSIQIWNSKTLLLLFHDLIFPRTSQIIECYALVNFSVLVLSPFLSNELLTLLHVASCWYNIINTCYQKLPIVTCQVNSWRIFSSTRGCTRKRLPIFTDIQCQISVTLFPPFFQPVSICHSWWVLCQFKDSKRGLKHLLLIFLLPRMLQYLIRRILWSVYGA